MVIYNIKGKSIRTLWPCHSLELFFCFKNRW